MQELTHTADVVVVGGGLAGVAAAVAAARDGSEVALVNNRPVLGGNSSSEVRVWVVGGTAHGAQKFARETGIMGELFLENQWRNPEGNPILWDHVLLDLVRAEERIRLFLNTDVHEVDASGPDGDRSISAAIGWQSGSEKRIRFEAPVFVDATGDGLVGALAGARFMTGREDRDAHGEPWAPDVADDDMLGSTILFYTKDVGEPVRFIPPGITKSIDGTSIPLHRHIDTTMNGCAYWWIEWGGQLDVVADNETIRDELWGLVFGIWDYIKNSGRFDADTLTLEWVGTIPGKREYRRLRGDYVLTQQDVLGQTSFDDNVGFGGWSIDLHPPGGIYSEAAGSMHLHGPGVYEIPFRSLYSVNISNLLMAGRDISASHVAFGSTRVMATCAVTGEAAGTGASLAARYGLSPRQLLAERREELLSTLVRQDASVLGVPWTDPRDLALSARVSASSTLRRLATCSSAGEEVSIADVDLALLLPADPTVEVVRLAVVATAATTATVELWSTGNGLTHIPVDHIETVAVPVPAGRSDLTAVFDGTRSPTGEAVVIVRRDPLLSVLVSAERPPYGVLGMLSRLPGLVHEGPQTNAWSTRELLRRTPVFSAEPATEAYRAQHAIGGLARPFNGPQLWSSMPMGAEPEWLELRWSAAQSIHRVELVFNDDVDEDLVNLHHHRTGYLVMPELVRGYRIEIAEGDRWTPVIEVEGNRARRRVHELDRPVAAEALRVVVLTTNGDPHAMIVAIRVFAS